MVYQCCVATCRNRRHRYKRGCSGESILHVFPKKKGELLKRWIEEVRPYVKRPDEWIPTPHHRLCSDHFEAKDYYLGLDKIKLREYAVPSVFIPSEGLGAADEDNPQPLWLKIKQETGRDLVEMQVFKKSQAKLAIDCAALGCPSRQDPNEKEDDDEEDDDIDEDNNDDSSEEGVGSKITFHKFPALPNMRKKWVRALGRKDAAKVSVDGYLCSLHFKRHELLKAGGKYLLPRPRPAVVPSVFELPPDDLMDMVELSAPYLQPKVRLARVDGKKPPPKKKPSRAHKVKALSLDHTYLKLENVDPEEEVTRLRNMLEQMKEKVMSTSQKVKCLKISVSALKSQYLMERDMWQGAPLLS